MRIVTGIVEHLHPPEFPDLVRWTSLRDGAPPSPAPDRPILYYFTAEWCAPCRTLKREAFGDREMASYINGQFHPVMVVDRQREDSRNAPIVDELERKFGVNAFPTLVAVGASPDQEPQVLRGYPGKKKTSDFLTAAYEKLYKPRRFFQDLAKKASESPSPPAASPPAR